MFKINHLHVKTAEPHLAAEWFARALGFRILSDERRTFGDRFVRCQTEDGGMIVIFSSARDGETLGPAATGIHHGLEHFGLDSTDLEADVARLVELGATLVEGPKQTRPDLKVAFFDVIGDVRIELMQRI
jgi:hypothetical protein